MARREARARSSQTQTVNHFLALVLDDDSRDELAAVQERLRAWELPARWVHPDDLHLTLLFLGALDEDTGEALVSRLDELAGRLLRPTLHLTGLGATGGRTEPRAVYAAVRDADEACAAIHDDFCAVLGRTRERNFVPHVTLCRPEPLTQPLPLFRDWPHLLEAHGDADWGPLAAASVALCRSSGQGVVRYETVASWELHA